MKNILIVAACLLAACEKVSDQPAPEPAAVPAAPAAETPRRAAPPTQFDARTVRVGDTIGGLRVAEVNVQPVATSGAGVAGSVRFSGEAELKGSYRRHFDYPEVKAPCFWLDVESWAKLPRAQGDTRLLWFCFENDAEAVKQLGEIGTEVAATIVVDNYTTNITQSDAWDTARLVRVVRKGEQ
jgi:hypothetical protein